MDSLYAYILPTGNKLPATRCSILDDSVGINSVCGSKHQKCRVVVTGGYNSILDIIDFRYDRIYFFESFLLILKNSNWKVSYT